MAFIKDLTGKKFGRLTAISVVPNKIRKGHRVWLCLCECGDYKEVFSSLLTQSKTRSCGCLIGNRKRKGESVDRFYASYFKKTQNEASIRNYSFNITFDHFKSLVLGNCYYCNKEPQQRFKDDPRKKHWSTVRVNGVDRRDNTVGYEETNVVSCCSVCNVMKMDLPLEEFFNAISSIYEHRINDKVQRQK